MEEGASYFLGEASVQRILVWGRLVGALKELGAVVLGRLDLGG